MQRTIRWYWLGALALAAGPTMAAAQDNSTQSHTVREGDTLWDLARQYRGDPFLWPDIFRMNTSVVEDPHWIYPGEVLALSGSESVASVPANDTPAPPASVTSADSAPAVEPAPASAPAGPVADELAESPTAGTAADEAPTQSLVAMTEQMAKAEEYTPLFGPKRSDTMSEALRAYTHQPYRALRRSEFYSSGFLSENQKLPFGKVLGPVTPPQIPVLTQNNNALPNTLIAVAAPKGASYQVGDSLLLVQVGREVRGYGDVILPNGIVQLTDTADGKYVGRVVATYGPIRSGLGVLPLERFADPGEVRAVPVSSGVTATLLGGSARQDLKAPQMVVFLDKGRQDGVAAGDLFEIRRQPERLSGGGIRVDETMATLQVVHVREHSATARLLNVISPDIPVGTQARQVAKLP